MVKAHVSVVNDVLSIGIVNICSQHLYTDEWDRSVCLLWSGVHDVANFDTKHIRSIAGYIHRGTHARKSEHCVGAARILIGC